MNRPLVAVVVLATVLLSARQYVVDHPVSQLTTYRQFAGLPAGTRLTVVSPHLDDETLGVGGLIAQARSQGIQVSVIFMTNGDDNPIGADLQFGTGYPTPEQLIQSGVARQQEALKALTDLGVYRQDIYFLGLPDRSLTNLRDQKYANTPYQAPGTLKSASPYAMSYVANLPYTGNAVRNALAKAVEATNPTLVLTTLPQDTHKDHQATAAFVKELMPSLPNTQLWYFLIHYRGFPNPRGIGSTKELLPPNGLKSLPWEAVFLSDDDIRFKQQAVSDYASQLKIPELGGLMKAMVRRNELLLPASR